jgi:hypothetical protein
MRCLQANMVKISVFLVVVLTAVATTAAQPEESTSPSSNTPTTQFQCQPFPTLAGNGE